MELPAPSTAPRNLAAHSDKWCRRAIGPAPFKSTRDQTTGAIRHQSVSYSLLSTMAFVISPSGMAQATCGRPRIGLTRPLQVSTHARGLAARCGATPSATRAPGMLVTLQPVPVVGMASSAFPAQKRAAPVASAAASTRAWEP